MSARPAVALAVQYAVPRRGLPSPGAVARWARAALPRRAEVAVRFVGAREARALNRTFRGRDYATNVLTFVYENRPRRPLAGDLVLCVPVVAREAREQGKPARAHYAHLLVHGALHLAGHDHERAADARRMQARERRILARLGFADPYAGPGARPRPPRRAR